MNNENNNPNKPPNKKSNRRPPSLTLPTPIRTPTLAHPLPLPPTTPPINFSDLQKLSNIGSGSGGTCYKVLHLPTNKIFALKIIHPHHDPPTLKQILKEIQILKNVHHPHIVTCHHIFTQNDQIQILLEFMHQGSLQNLHVPNENQLSNLTKQILSALFYLHKRKIIHRDIKPSNLLVNMHGDVKISDFGVSTILAKTMEECNTSVGTIAYMSPERINTDLSGGKYDGSKGDVWSLGVSVLEFYLGRFPFEAAREGGWASLMCAICMSDPPEVPGRASWELRDFVGCCLRKEPEKRWSVARLLGHPFIVGGENNSGTTDLTRQMLRPPS